MPLRERTLSPPCPARSHFLTAEWIRHGTCYGWRSTDLFREALSLLDEVNGSAVQALFAGNIGKEITVGKSGQPSTQLSVQAPGIASAILCDGSRRLIIEITIGLVAQPGNSNKLADLIKASAATDPGCPGGIIDPVGFQ
jgi:ribonuclease T2